MNTPETPFGTSTGEADGTVTLRYERIYARPIKTVCSAISEPERIADWLGTADLDTRVGGRFSVMVGAKRDIPIKGEVVAWEPPSLLSCSWTWPGGVAGVIRYELSAEGPETTRLVFTHSGLPREQMDSVLPGWHLYLERLGQAIEGGLPEQDFTARHAEVRASYTKHYGTEAAVCQT